MINLNEIIEQAIRKDASDIHLMQETKPIYRIGNSLVKMEGGEILNNEDMYRIYNYFTQGNMAKNKFFKEHKKLDTLYEYDGINFGVNLSYSNNTPVYTMKILKNRLPQYEELGIPDIVRKATSQAQGLILVSGTRKSGKTTTLNALVRHINETQNKKIITLEKTIEYTHKVRNSIIIQKEVGQEKDCLTYYDGIKNALKEDCDILIIEEIRDRETMEAALEVAESGRLVIAGLNTKSCVDTLDKILNFYDLKDQTQIKYLLSTLLKVIIHQKLIVATSGELELVPEVMAVTDKIVKCIRKEKINMVEIEKEIDDSKECVSLVNSLANLYVENKITLKQAKSLLDDEKKELLNNTVMRMRIQNK